MQSHALQTLLHEMIHAYCFLNKLRDADPTGHGAPFLAKMHFINRATFPDSQVWTGALLKSPGSGLDGSLTAWPCHALGVLSPQGMPRAKVRPPPSTVVARCVSQWLSAC